MSLGKKKHAEDLYFNQIWHILASDRFKLFMKIGKILDFLEFVVLIFASWLFLPKIMASSKIFKSKETASRFSASNHEFTLNLYKQLAERKKDENLFYSPFSISAALSMVYLGARKSTLEQMTKALVLQELGEDVHGAFESYIKDILTGNENFTLKTANRLYPNTKANLIRDYMNLCTKHYYADVTPLDFSQSEASRQEINNWVSQQTDGKIKDLIPSGVLNDLPALVLVNAIYFKGNWASQFEKSHTRPMPFHMSNGQEVQVDMMYQKEKFRYMYDHELQFAALEIPYKGEDLSMMFILPDTVDGLSVLEGKLTPNMLGKISKEMHSEKIEVYLPKFKLESEFELSDVLGAMGMPEAFDEDNADFSGIVESKDIYISKVIHKAFLEVSEEGTEAAAATGIVFQCYALELSPQFIADRPFLFLINDQRNDVMLFAGRLGNPRN